MLSTSIRVRVFLGTFTQMTNDTDYQLSFTYFLTSVMSGVGIENTYIPFVCGFLLLISGIYVAIYFSPTKSISPRLALYLSVVMTLGVVFEWNLVSSGKGFTYGICPSFACLGTFSIQEPSNNTRSSRCIELASFLILACSSICSHCSQRPFS